MPELVWEGKYGPDGRKIAPMRVALPFQTVETVNESAQERQQSLDLFGGRDAAWRNRLIWGDKKYVLPALAAEIPGQVNLIYIDRPFATGQDFSLSFQIEGEQFVKEPSLIEMKAYRDTWGAGLDSYLEWIYGMAVHFNDLLGETGSLYVHVDPGVSHYVKSLLDEVFGREQFRSELIWKRSTAHSDAKQGRRQFGGIHDVLLFYTKGDRWTWNPIHGEYDDEYINKKYGSVEPETGRRFMLDNLTGPGAASKGNPSYEVLGITRYWRYSKEKMAALIAEGRVVQPSPGAVPRYKRYLDEMPGVPIQDVWTDLMPVNSMAVERVGYPTQKPEALLERILSVSSNEGDLVLDCVCGSGTTAVVAERLRRRWIACDLGRFAIHTTRKRLLNVAGVSPFVVQNLGKYERQVWQVAEFGESAAARTTSYRAFILALYGARPVQGCTWLHGLKSGHMVHVGTVDTPVTVGDVKQIAMEFRKTVGKGKDSPSSTSVDVLGWDFAFEVNEVARQDAAKAGIDMRFIRIPREVLDKRAVAQGDVRFYELAALALDVQRSQRRVTLTMTSFVIPLDDVPEDIRRAVSKWPQWIDYWAVDWDNHGDTFHNEWQVYRSRKNPDLELSTSHEYSESGDYKIVVKVTTSSATTPPRPSPWRSPVVPRKRIRPGSEQASLLEARVTTAPCVPAIRKAVTDWRERKYKGASETSKLLLNYWFAADHRMLGSEPFAYYFAQREAIETLVYLFEVEGIRRHRDLIERYATVPGVHVLQNDDFARYAIKMATGSGKTKVMALTIAWQYFNAVAEGRDDYARSFLLLAPNVIVFERLRSDFAGGRIFRADPVIPPELRIFWDLDCYMRGESERSSSEGALYVANIQQLYDRPATDSNEPEEMTDVLGPIPPVSDGGVEGFDVRIAARGVSCLVLNDEGHHTHDEESEWNQVIRRLHESLPSGLTGQLDVSATPRYAKGGLFTWTVFDYPLKQAIIDNVVKRPMKGTTAGIKDQPSDIASVKYRAYLTAGVERWREYRDQLARLGKKPVLFVMLNSTTEADDVGDYLRVKYPEEFGATNAGHEQLLVIHTDRSGEVSRRDLDAAREVARRVDEGSSPVNAIVSVLMLREGWDVQNVTVIVGLRPYTSKANILPEQTIGRGLRLMFGNTGTAYTERVDIIGNTAFLKFVEQLEQDEDITLDSFDLKEPLVITTIAADPTKADKDITLPILSPLLARKKTLAEEIAALDVAAMDCPVLPKKANDVVAQHFHYEGVDIISLQRLIERDYSIPEPQTAEEVISYYAKRISQDVKLPSQFAALVPKVREFLETKAFGEIVNLSDKAMIKAIATSVAQYVTIKTFAAALRGLVVEELVPTLEGEGRPLSITEPFPFSRPTFKASKTVFNLVAADNEFERDFAHFLQDATDVRAFAKLPQRFTFAIEYTDSATNLRYYEPDFVAVGYHGDHYLIETKGREDVDVAHKDRAALIWCESATLLTDTPWSYIKVPQLEWNMLQPVTLDDVRIAFTPVP